MTYIPKTRPGGNDGLVLVRGVYHAAYETDGRRRRVSLGTDNPKEARRRRDEFYALLTAKGAVAVSGKADRTLLEALAGDPGHYIRERDAYVVNVQGVHVGTAPDKKTALKLRDEYLATTLATTL
jgi:hypothetical protein